MATEALAARIGMGTVTGAGFGARASDLRRLLRREGKQAAIGALAGGAWRRSVKP
jgi:hypothetical protein